MIEGILSGGFVILLVVLFALLMVFGGDGITNAIGALRERRERRRS